MVCVGRRLRSILSFRGDPAKKGGILYTWELAKKRAPILGSLYEGSCFWGPYSMILIFGNSHLKPFQAVDVVVISVENFH